MKRCIIPRKPRVFVIGSAYHVHRQASQGERPFADEEAAHLFVDTLARVKAEHGLAVLAWCLMPNHYHLVVRAGELPLWRSMRLVQGRFTKALNRRQRLRGRILPRARACSRFRACDGPSGTTRLFSSLLAHHHRHLRPLATNPGEKCGPGAHNVQKAWWGQEEREMNDG